MLDGNDEQIETAFLAVYNKHITFVALCNNFPKRESKIISLKLSKIVLTLWK